MSGQAFIAGCRGTFFRNRALGSPSWDIADKATKAAVFTRPRRFAALVDSALEP